ncbi:MAG: HAD hydrolase-like protein [Spirochaeta sp.]|nr:HAD hydrolase-like protein [Spirochaeta sp.]
MNGLLDKYRYVLWDWNGTLLNDLWLALEIANAMLHRRGLPVMDEQRYREIFDFPVAEYYRRAGFDFDREPFPVLAEEFIGEFNRRVKECALHAGATEILEAIAQDGKRQAVLSASHQESLTATVALHGIRDHFDELQGLADNLAVSKEAAGHALLAAVAVDPTSVVLIGDTTHDYDVAVGLGVACILVADGHQAQSRLEATGVPVVSSLSALL